MIEAAADNPLLARLEPGERLLWSGKPNKRAYILHDMYLLLMPLLGVLSIPLIFIELLLLRNIQISGPATLIPPVLGLEALLIVAAILARIWMTARTATNTHYVLTDQRVLIRTGLFSRQEVSHPLAALPDLQLSKQGEQCGTIIFAPISRWQQIIGGSWFVGGVAFARRISGGSTRPPAFVTIDRATEVYNLAETARRQAQQEQQRNETRLLTGNEYSV